jgi:putative aldouronate transport system permease protein
MEFKVYKYRAIPFTETMITRKNSLKPGIKNPQGELILMSIPAVLFFFLFHYVPMGGVILAFKQYQIDKGFLGSPWVGFENFRFFFISGKAWLVTRNTVLYNLVFILTGTFLQITVAIFLSEIRSKLFKRISQSSLFLPHFISWVVIGAFAYNLFSYEYGIINSVLLKFNLPPVNIYGTPGAWKYILVFVNAWKWVGYGSIIYLASIISIDSSFYESAKMDGANIFQQIFYITIPSITPVIVTLFLLNLGTLLRGDFQMFYQLTGQNSLLYNATDVIDTYVYRSLTKNFNVGMSAAAGLFQSVFCFITIIAANGLVKRISRDYSLF